MGTSWPRALIAGQWDWKLSGMLPVPRRGNRDSRCGVGLYCARRLSAMAVGQKRHSPAGRVRIRGICAATGFTACVISSSTQPVSYPAAQPVPQSPLYSAPQPFPQPVSQPVSQTAPDVSQPVSQPVYQSMPSVMPGTVPGAMPGTVPNGPFAPDRMNATAYAPTESKNAASRRAESWS